MVVEQLKQTIKKTKFTDGNKTKLTRDVYSKKNGKPMTLEEVREFNRYMNRQKKILEDNGEDVEFSIVGEFPTQWLTMKAFGQNEVQSMDGYFSGRAKNAEKFANEIFHLSVTIVRRNYSGATA